MQIKQTEIYEEWERGITDVRLRAAIAARLYRLANGLEGDVAPVGEGISELRIHYGAGYRIYFQRCGSTIILLLCGGNKSSQRRDILNAKWLAKNWND
ncbi:type II toxin-antitoxin system RelE/ParE family toxin [Phyllobacterium sp. YR531]|uniref:type II toxin-antitoxin system RelE/ParE family toxin n=1 Tax=Phyllobacterium sp. YR531 TaxID=1144343 RepID=UPI00026F5234|nr:putative addiction module killer protein [Phyllobacterium sp. YR531]